HRFRARRRRAVVGTRLHRHVESRTACTVACRLECDHLRMRVALALVPALADDIVSCNDDRPDDRIRPSPAAPALGELDRPFQVADPFGVTTSPHTEPDSFAVASSLGFLTHASSWTRRRYARGKSSRPKIAEPQTIRSAPAS